MKFNYPQICLELFRDLTQRQKEVILRRFGLKKPGQKETLEAIGESYGVTRERVRQIEESAIAKLKEKTNNYQKVFQYFIEQLKKTGGLKKEEFLFSLLGEENLQNQIFFLMTLSDKFIRFPETKDCHAFWAINQQSVELAQKAIESFNQKLAEINQPVKLQDFKTFFSKINPQTLLSYLEISKQIQQNSEGLFGLRSWPEINPRGVKDKAYLVFKKEARPLHFTEVARFIAEQNREEKKGCPNPQSVHNELIRDPRFVLVGRGLYSLQEWGYASGVVKDIIFNVLKETREPLTKQEVIAAVSKQRFVKENTILLNLSNKKYFMRTPEGKYVIKEI